MRRPREFRVFFSFLLFKQITSQCSSDSQVRLRTRVIRYKIYSKSVNKEGDNVDDLRERTFRAWLGNARFNDSDNIIMPQRKARQKKRKKHEIHTYILLRSVVWKKLNDFLFACRTNYIRTVRKSKWREKSIVSVISTVCVTRGCLTSLPTLGR